MILNSWHGRNQLLTCLIWTLKSELCLLLMLDRITVSYLPNPNACASLIAIFIQDNLVLVLSWGCRLNMYHHSMTAEYKGYLCLINCKTEHHRNLPLFIFYQFLSHQKGIFRLILKISTHLRRHPGHIT